jgi:hypothetical protein
MVLVFKTSVQNKSHISKLKPLLDKAIKKGIWNFDIEDCDKILRIESKADVTKTVIHLLYQNGFDCVELKD